MKRKKLTRNHLLLIIIAISVVIQVILLNKHSTMGDQLTLINQKIDGIVEENNLLNQNIASFSAMTTIAQRAQQYGLVSTSRIVSLASSLPLASNLKLSL